MSSDSRETRILSVACPRCGAGEGQPCRNPIEHQAERGPQDRRKQPTRAHSERRKAWRTASYAEMAALYKEQVSANGLGGRGEEKV